MARELFAIVMVMEAESVVLLLLTVSGYVEKMESGVLSVSEQGCDVYYAPQP